MRPYYLSPCLAALVLVPTSSGFEDPRNWQKQIQQNVNSFLRRVKAEDDSSLTGFRRQTSEIENFLFELVFYENATESTEEDRSCISGCIEDNMADIATAYLIEELGYPSNTRWGQVDEVEYNETKAKLEASRDKLLRELEYINMKQKQCQKKIDKKTTKKFAEKENKLQEEIDKLMLEVEEEALKAQEEGKKNEKKAEMKLAQKLEELEELLIEKEAFIAKTTQKMLEDLTEEEIAKKEELEDILRQLEDLEDEFSDVSAYLKNKCKKKKGDEKQQCVKRFRRRSSIFTAKVRCNLCRPENSDSGRRELLDKEEYDAFQAEMEFALWMEEKMADKLRELCPVAALELDFVIFSYDEVSTEKDTNSIFSTKAIDGDRDKSKPVNDDTSGVDKATEFKGKTKRPKKVKAAKPDKDDSNSESSDSGEDKDSSESSDSEDKDKSDSSDSGEDSS